HIIKQGIIKLNVKGKHQTAPKLKWVKVSGDNIIQARLYDGSKIQQVKATFISKNDLAVSFDAELKDDRTSGDKIEDDNV
ncbi:hypothetical protein, partial [Bradyrhizobium sp. 23AC]